MTVLTIYVVATPPTPPQGLRLPSFPEHRVAVKYATEHRCGVVVRGPGLTDAVTGTDPLKDGLPLATAAPLDDSPEARHREWRPLCCSALAMSPAAE